MKQERLLELAGIITEAETRLNRDGMKDLGDIRDVVEKGFDALTGQYDEKLIDSMMQEIRQILYPG